MASETTNIACLQEFVNHLKADIAALSHGDWQSLNSYAEKKAELIHSLGRFEGIGNSEEIKLMAQEGMELVHQAQLLLNLAVDRVRRRLQGLSAAIGHEESLHYGADGLYARHNVRSGHCLI